MSTATVIDIADAVLAEIRDDSELLPVGAVLARGYAPVFDLKDMAQLHVTVVPKSLAIERTTRALREIDVEIDIGVQKKIGSGELAEMDDWMLLVERLIDFMDNRALSGAAAARFIRADNSPIFDPEHYSGMRQFTSVITLTYRLMR